MYEVDAIPVHADPVFVVGQKHMTVGRLVIADGQGGAAPDLLLDFGQAFVAIEEPEFVKTDARTLGNAMDLLNEQGKGLFPVRQELSRLAACLFPGQSNGFGDDLLIAIQGS
jgi:hypothetical protein